MLHMTNISIFIPSFDQKIYFWQTFTSNAIFTIGVPVKNAFLGSCHHFQAIIFCLNSSVETIFFSVNAYK